MERFFKIFRQPEFQGLIFAISVLIFNWPLLTFSEISELRSSFVHLFICWALVIIVQFLISRAVISESEDREKP